MTHQERIDRLCEIRYNYASNFCLTKEELEERNRLVQECIEETGQCILPSGSVEIVNGINPWTRFK